MLVTQEDQPRRHWPGTNTGAARNSWVRRHSVQGGREHRCVRARIPPLSWTCNRWQERASRQDLSGKQTFLLSHFSRCPTLCDPRDCSPPGSSVRGVLQARILQWVAMPSSRGSSPPRDRTWVSYVSCIGRQVLYHECHLGSPKRY